MLFRLQVGRANEVILLSKFVRRHRERNFWGQIFYPILINMKNWKIFLASLEIDFNCLTLWPIISADNQSTISVAVGASRRRRRPTCRRQRL